MVAVFEKQPKYVPMRQLGDGPLLGNGDLGVTIGGPPNALQFWIGKNDFWRAAGRVVDGSRFGRTLGSPCGITAIGMCVDPISSSVWHAEQDMRDAEVRLEFPTYTEKGMTFRAWIPATENLLVIELTSTDDAWIDLELETRTARLGETESDYGEDGFVRLRRSFREGVEWPSEAAVCIRRIDCDDAPGWHYKMLEAGTTATIVAVVRTNHDTGDDFMQVAERRARELTLEDIEVLRKEHRQWWADFWSKSSIDIGGPIEKAWYGAQYIIACCSRNREFPPGLFGNWLMSDEPYWAGDYHLNYDYEAAWWGAYSSNRVELTDPYDPPLMAFIPQGRKNAQKFLGCRGIYCEVGIGPKGLAVATDLFHGQKSNAAYAAVNMAMRYDYTRDLDYARDIAYPFLIEVADFWEDYLKFEHGRYVIYQDAIHETTEDHEDFNPVLSLGLIRMVLEALLKMSRDLDRDAGRHEEWQHILDYLSEFPTYEREGTTIFRLTESGMEWCDGNTLAIQHIFPSGAIGLDSTPALLEIARNTVAVLARWGCVPTFFAAAARVGHDPSDILEHLLDRVENHMFPNMLLAECGGAIETCGGITVGVNEMLLQSYEGVIRLFPVWPRERAARFETLRAAGAFLISAELRDGVVQPVIIESEKGCDCTVQNPWQGKRPAVFELNDGKETVVEIEAAGDRFTFKTRPGGRYTVKRDSA